jgi:hypothetical protein
MAYSLQRKIEVVSAILGGATIPEASKSSGVPEGLITKWRDVAISSLSIGLRFTNDEGELPSLVTIMQKVDIWRFPLSLLNGAVTGICFYPTYHYGELTVALLQAAGLTSIAIADRDLRSLQHMLSIYPNCEEAIVEEPVHVARMLAKAGRKFDVVVCDPPSASTPLMAGDHFSLFCGLARKGYIFALTTSAMEELGVREPGRDLEAQLSALHGVRIRVNSLLARNSAIYWVGVRALE